VEYVLFQQRDRTLKHYEKRMDYSNLAKRTEDLFCLLGKAVGPRYSHWSLRFPLQMCGFVLRVLTKR
jgi:hypothetical protein